MRSISLAAILITACGNPPAPPAPQYQEVAAAVDPARLTGALADLSGERYDDTGRARFQATFTAKMNALGMDVTAFDYQWPVSTRAGRNLEAVLPGRSADSIVIVVHYDSMGEPGQATINPAVDDDMTGMSILLETARVLAARKDRLQHTVRFVATDEEEEGDLAGARTYAQGLTARGVHVIAAVDDEQTGWSCAKDGVCDPDAPLSFDIYSCTDDGLGYSFPALGDQLEQAAHDFSTLHTNRLCMGQNSDHYAFWEIGVPAVVFTEHEPFSNPHFDRGDDTLERIDQTYFTSIAKPVVVFQAELAGLDP